MYKQQQSRSAIEGSRETRLFRGEGAQNPAPARARAAGYAVSGFEKLPGFQGMCNHAGVQGDPFNKGELFGMLNLLDTGMRHKARPAQLTPPAAMGRSARAVGPSPSLYCWNDIMHTMTPV